MSASGRPWWASDTSDGHVDDGDPVARHRAARRGGTEHHAKTAASDAGADRRDADWSNQDGHDPRVCGVCPICAGTRWLQGAHPEVFDHLREAAQHLTLAAKALLDGSGDTTSGEAGDRDGRTPGRVHDDSTHDNRNEDA